MSDDSPQTNDETASGPAATAKKAGAAATMVALLGVTLLAVLAGAGFGAWTAGHIDNTVSERTAHLPTIDEDKVIAYSGDTVLLPIEAVITNLASPTNVWVRLESAMIFRNGELENPDVTAAHLRQDILAYLRTLTLDQLGGASALQHVREDLAERVQLRTGGSVRELVIQALIVQ